MSPGLIELEVEDFADACGSLAAVVGLLNGALSSLDPVLGGCGGMAGGDPAGLAWAAQYDHGVAAVLAASVDTADGCARLSAMFAQTARNWAAAEAASTAGHGSSALPALPALPCVVAVRAVPAPSAAGVGSVAPAGWELIAHLVDCVWPNGHLDRLRRSADAWDACALVFQDRSDAAATAAVLAQLHRLPEADDMRTACFAMGRHLRDLAAAQRSLAAACRAYAARLDSVHAQVIDELESLAEWSAGIQAVGAVFSVFTAGVAQVPTQAMQASRLAACAARVSDLIAGFVASARGLAAALPSVADLADSIALALRPLLGTRLAVAGVTDVRALPSVTRAARVEMAAEGRLARGSDLANTRPRDFPDAQLQKKFKHAAAFGVTENQSLAGLKAFRARLLRFLSEPTTSHVRGLYQGDAAILSYDVRTQLVVIRHADGSFWTCWRMTAAQARYVAEKGLLGGH